MPLFDQLKNFAGDKVTELLGEKGTQITENLPDQVQEGLNKVKESAGDFNLSNLGEKASEVKDSIQSQLESPGDLLNSVKDVFKK
ncbi:hypothetical protein MFLO_06634 [Listeria floridensis FSL S10-1187]|uniref:Uncharacterized protein n=1 Tax=Listeria floridensis FSL S10-1187 TaxID=1265817 RepID=A0ABN0RFZ2_9LIST|nr:hypothetical protein [Listeria floridensis]EUJ32758.1 hypothetical protein MFLO_06634 [Listeria floridensis FSL S10-1187]